MSQVRLTPLTLADADSHLAGEDEALARWLSGGRSTPATVDAYLRKCVEDWTSSGPVHAFGIRVGEAAELAGTVEVQYAQPYLASDQVNLTYGLYPPWRRRGIATRAVELACTHARAHGAETAVIRVDPSNQASARVARRAGFTFEPELTTATENGLDWYVRHLVCAL